MAKALFLLTLFHLVFFRHFYFQNPYCYATSEALEQGFASSRLLGEHLRRFGFWTLRSLEDRYYYPNYSGLSFLSSYYPPHRLQAWLGSFLSLNHAWILYALTMVLHFLLSSYGVLWGLYQSGAGWVLSVFGAMTLTYLGYSLKQNSCIIYTLVWVPLVFLSSWQHSWGFLGISLGMMLLAGYWPLALYAIPLGCLAWQLPLFSPH